MESESVWAKAAGEQKDPPATAAAALHDTTNSTTERARIDTDTDNENMEVSLESSSTTTNALVVERTIRIMQQTGLTVHPHHCHSFQAVSVWQLLGASVSLLGYGNAKNTTAKNGNCCVICHQGMSSTTSSWLPTFSTSSSSSSLIVQCVACGGWAHRSCSSRPPKNDHQPEQQTYNSFYYCRVNAPEYRHRLRGGVSRVERTNGKVPEQQQHDRSLIQTVSSSSTKTTSNAFTTHKNTNQNSHSDIHHPAGLVDAEANDPNGQRRSNPLFFTPSLSGFWSRNTHNTHNKETTTTNDAVAAVRHNRSQQPDDTKPTINANSHSIDDDDDDVLLAPVAGNSTPPNDTNDVKTTAPLNVPPSASTMPMERLDDGPTTIASSFVREVPPATTEQQPFHLNTHTNNVSNQSFANIARALQENVLASFQKRNKLQGDNKNSSNTSKDIVVMDGSSFRKTQPTPRRRTIAAYPGAASRCTRHPSGNNQSQCALSIPTSNDYLETPPPNTIIHPHDSIATKNIADRATTTTTKTLDAIKAKVSVSAVAGGIAGGLAGLAIAGPVGAVAGYYVCAASSSLFLVAEATALGVVMAGVATGGVAGQQIQGHWQERRVLSIGEEGASQKVLLLVRPNVKIDPIWKQIYRDALLSAPVPSSNLLQLGRKGAPRRDADIVYTAEEELDTSDKVLLLANRMLNDKSSRSGHVYRFLIDTFDDRCRRRATMLAESSETASIRSFSPRSRRDDAHAVIKHVTAALLEEQPVLGSSPGLTELTATAVENLVFCQIYDAVFSEISDETCDRDVDLWRKITAFEKKRLELQAGEDDDTIADSNDHAKDDDDDDAWNSVISNQALNSLRMLPESHSVSDKLYFCGLFLDQIASEFLARTAQNICADSLLQVVCQHLIAIENQGCCHAQLAFLEEFVHDEQVLCGRDGYALATLQASLHFLHESEDLHTIFYTSTLEIGGNDQSPPYQPSDSYEEFDCNEADETSCQIEEQHQTA